MTKRAIGFPVLFALLLISGCSPFTISSAPQHPTATESSMPAPAKTAEPSPTVFSIPDEITNNLHQYMEWLFSLNREEVCQLPCWWGFEPGKTNLKSLQEVLSPFGMKEISLDADSGTSNYSFGASDSYVGYISFSAIFAGEAFQGIGLSLPLERSSTEGL